MLRGLPGSVANALEPRVAPRASVVVCTYNAPQQLDLVLTGLARQSVMPEEIVIADDGSGDQTAALVAERAARSKVPIRHLWQEDRGMRKAAICNAAMAVVRGERVLFLDGDSVPHRRWLVDHLNRGDGRTVLCGRRVRLGGEWSLRLTREFLEGGATDHAWSRFLVEGLVRGQVRHYELALRLPPAFLRFVVGPKQLMGCNFSAPRAALEKINGYDAAWPGAAQLSEDLDLEIRLALAGFAIRPIAHAGIVFHLHHPERPRSAEALRLREERRAVTESWAVDGIEEARRRLESGEIVDRLSA